MYRVGNFERYRTPLAYCGGGRARQDKGRTLDAVCQGAAKWGGTRYRGPESIVSYRL